MGPDPGTKSTRAVIRPTRPRCPPWCGSWRWLRRCRPGRAPATRLGGFHGAGARSALLALAYVLAKGGVVLDQIGPVAQVRRPAGGPDGAAALADLVATLIEGTLRRLGRDRHDGRVELTPAPAERGRPPTNPATSR